MSVGLDPPQMAARWPLPKPQSHLRCGWKGRAGKREAIGTGFASHQPWPPPCPVLAAHLSEVPIVTGWIKCFLFILSQPLTSVCSSGPPAGPELLLWLVTYSPFLGAAEMEAKMCCFPLKEHRPLPTGGGGVGKGSSWPHKSTAQRGPCLPPL